MAAKQRSLDDVDADLSSLRAATSKQTRCSATWMNYWFQFLTHTIKNVIEDSFNYNSDFLILVILTSLNSNFFFKLTKLWLSVVP